MRNAQVFKVWIAVATIHCVIYLATSQEGMSNDVIRANFGLKRHKRSDDAAAFGLTSQEVNDIVNVHNTLRRLINASDMEFMVWDDALAHMAIEWAEGCKWGHGQPPMHDDVDFVQLGQNLYYNTGVRNATHAITRWYYAEEDFYNHETGACSGMCGHYTQLIWAESREVGCAYGFCEAMTDMASGKVINNAWYFACNYGPAGNVKDNRPYTQGPSCSACPSGQYWCDTTSPRGLCRRDCDKSKSNCECKAECANGGAPDCDCKCSCADGWTDVRCTKECKNYNSHCGKSPGYPEYSCWDPTYGASIKNMCPQLCGMCDGATDDSSSTVAPCLFSQSTTVAPATDEAMTNSTSVTSTVTYEFTDSTIDITTPDSPEATSEDSTDDISSSSSSSLPSSSSSPVSVTGSQGTPTPTNGFVDDSYIAWVYLETMKPEEINQVKEVLQQHVADRANEYCQTEKCCPDSKEWIAGVTLDKQDVTIEVHSWVDGVTKVSVHIRLDHVCSSDSYIKTRTSSSELVFLPKEVLVTILQEELDKLNSTLHDCCTVSIISVKETGDEPSDKDQPDKPSGKMSKTWITAVVVIVVNAALVLIALSIALAIKRRRRNKSSKLEDVKPSHGGSTAYLHYSHDSQSVDIKPERNAD